MDRSGTSIPRGRGSHACQSCSGWAQLGSKRTKCFAHHAAAAQIISDSVRIRERRDSLRILRFYQDSHGNDYALGLLDLLYCHAQLFNSARAVMVDEIFQILLHDSSWVYIRSTLWSCALLGQVEPA
jgi:hypothetical protein